MFRVEFLQRHSSQSSLPLKAGSRHLVKKIYSIILLWIMKPINIGEVTSLAFYWLKNLKNKAVVAKIFCLMYHKSSKNQCITLQCPWGFRDQIILGKNTDNIHCSWNFPLNSLKFYSKEKLFSFTLPKCI
jgi:hypothetical protein